MTTILNVVVVGSIAARECWESRGFKEAVSVRESDNL
jgi:hypothetical protein